MLGTKNGSEIEIPPRFSICDSLAQMLRTTAQSSGSGGSDERYSHGADWWLASDGKWYHRQLGLERLASSAASASWRDFKQTKQCSSGLSGTLQVFMWIAAATLAISALLDRRFQRSTQLTTALG